VNESRALAVPGQRGSALVPWTTELDEQTDVALSKSTRNGLIAIAVLVFGFGGLMAFLPMAGAVIAVGEVSVETQVKQIAHPFGGVAADILVRDGDLVKQGDVLIRLDDTVAGANADLTGLSLDQLLAKEARLRASRDGAGGISFPEELLERANDPVVQRIMEDERREFVLSRAARGDQGGQLEARVRQTQAEIASANSRIAALTQQERLIQQELDQTRELYESRLSTLDRLNALERAAVDIAAQRSIAQSSIAASQARISELRTQMSGLGSESRSNSAAELARVQALIAESRQREVQASDTNDRTAIRAPQDGYINKLAIRTIGGVVPAGQTLLEIVPANDRLVIEAQVAPTDIDQVVLNQPAFMRFSSLPMRTTPEIEGIVMRVDPDRRIDQVTGVAYYSATIEIPEAEMAKLGAIKLSVGMPVEVFIQTGERTILNYILRPVVDQLKRALRE